MIKCSTDLSRFMPIDREKAGRLTAVACKYECTLTLERDNIILNLKSMIGLLSQSIPKDGQMMLVADGTDEKEASEAICALLA